MNTRYILDLDVKRLIELVVNWWCKEGLSTRHVRGLAVKRLSARHVLGLVVEGLIEC